MAALRFGIHGRLMTWRVASTSTKRPVPGICYPLHGDLSEFSPYEAMVLGRSCAEFWYFETHDRILIVLFRF